MFDMEQPVGRTRFDFSKQKYDSLGNPIKKRKKLPKDPLKSLLDKLSNCIEQKWQPDRLGGYVDTRLDRRKARKVIEEWLKHTKTSQSSNTKSRSRARV